MNETITPTHGLLNGHWIRKTHAHEANRGGCKANEAALALRRICRLDEVALQKTDRLVNRIRVVRRIALFDALLDLEARLLALFIRPAGVGSGIHSNQDEASRG